MNNVLVMNYRRLFRTELSTNTLLSLYFTLARKHLNVIFVGALPSQSVFRAFIESLAAKASAYQGRTLTLEVSNAMLCAVGSAPRREKPGIIIERRKLPIHKLFAYAQRRLVTIRPVPFAHFSVLPVHLRHNPFSYSIGMLRITLLERIRECLERACDGGRHWVLTVLLVGAITTGLFAVFTSLILAGYAYDYFARIFLAAGAVDFTVSVTVFLVFATLHRQLQDTSRRILRLGLYGCALLAARVFRRI